MVLRILLVRAAYITSEVLCMLLIKMVLRTLPVEVFLPILLVRLVLRILLVKIVQLEKPD